jgi:hypothetical protein
LVEATKTDTTRKAAFHAEDAQLPSQSQVQTNQDLAADDALLTTQEQKLDEAKQKVADLLLTLNVPEELTNTDAATGLRSESLRQYWPYFQARNEFEDMERYTAIVRLKVWQDHGAQGSLGGALSQ